MANRLSDYLRTTDAKGESIVGNNSNLNQLNSETLKNLLALSEQLTAETQKRVQLKNKEFSSARALADLEDKRYEKALALQRREFELNKQILAIRLKMSENSDKENKKLEKRISVIEKTKKLESELNKVKEQYDDAMEERKALRSAQKENQKYGQELLKDGLQSGDLKQALAGFKLSLTGGQNGIAGLVKSLDTMTNALGDLSKKLNASVEELVKYKSDWDTRLFGSGSNHSNLIDAVTNAIGASPFVKQSDVMKKIDDAISRGIAYNIEQRAFLETIKDDIATTFDAFDSTLLDIIRIQRSDSTAARLGMEANLNSYLNSMFSTTEYLKNVSDNVTSSLYQATSLMNSEESIGFEYQVQKWLGSLYSVGMSSGSVQNIASAIGKLASGDISGTQTDAGKLLVMAASKAGLSYSEMLTNGINDSDLNSLMQSMVEYLESIANSNKVVQAQYAQIYGLTTSDIKAASNLSGDIMSISNNGKGYNYRSAISNLQAMAGSIGSRMSLGEMLSNSFSNLEYTIAGGIASNPAMYAIWKVAGMLDDYMGGINIPAVSVMGNMVDLETTVADLMKVGVMSTSVLGGLGSIISSIGGIGTGLNNALSNFGIGTNVSYVTRGSGLNSLATGLTQSQSSYRANSNSGDVYDSEITSASDQKRELQVAAEEENEEVRLSEINSNIVLIREVLESVIESGRLKVTIGSDSSFPLGY